MDVDGIPFPCLQVIRIHLQLFRNKFTRINGFRSAFCLYGDDISFYFLKFMAFISFLDPSPPLDTKHVALLSPCVLLYN